LQQMSEGVEASRSNSGDIDLDDWECYAFAK
jgi:hypothetical protein